MNRRRAIALRLAAFILRPRTLVVLAVVVAFAGLGIWRGIDPGNPCSPGYRESTANLAWTYGPCRDMWVGRPHHARPTCALIPGAHRHPAPFALPSCVAIAKGARP